jgi:hypothetical protein
MCLLEGGAGLVEFVDHLEQVVHAVSGSVVEAVALLFVVDDEAATGLVQCASYLLV